MGQLKIHKNHRGLIDEALDRGWVLTITRHGHPKLTAPDGYATPIPSKDVPGLTARWRKRLLSHPSFADDR